MKTVLALFFTTIIMTFMAEPARSDLVSDINKVETHAIGTAPKVIAGVLIGAAAASIVFLIFGGRFSSLGWRLGICLVMIAVVYLAIVNTDVGKGLNSLLNISDAKSMFKPS